MTYSSRDFGKTRATLDVAVPERLHHPNVMGDGAVDTRFSAERKHPVYVVDLPTRNVSMTIGRLLPGQVTNRHRHTYETVIYVLEGEGVTTVEDREIAWRPGDALYIPQWAWHFHRNVSEVEGCAYVACENAPQMQNLGVALREEAESP